MPAVDEFVVGAFQLPGNEESAFSLRDATIHSMESLLRKAIFHEDEHGDLAIVFQLMQRRLSCVQRDAWFSSAELSEALHAISAHNSVLRNWHAAVATPSINDVAPPADDDAGYLGAFLLPLVLRDSPQVCGRFALRTDLLGRLVFPDSDWRIEFRQLAQMGDTGNAEPTGVLSRELVLLYLDPFNASFYREDGLRPCLTIPRMCLMRLLANQPYGVAYQVHQPDELDVKLVRTTRFDGLPIRYDPAYFASSENLATAGMVGGVIEQILFGISSFAPDLHTEIRTLVQTVRGYEIPAVDGNLIGSFSDPTQPGVINMNVTFEGDQPRLDPYCFTWFGHELAHTRNYLIDTIAWQEGLAFVRNRCDMTPRIARYGRSFPVRTLIQIPYVHLYEWELLMDAWQSGADSLPWAEVGDPSTMVDEIRAEIADGFDFISRYADLTELGQAALDYQLELYRECKRRWSRIRGGRVYFG